MAMKALVRMLALLATGVVALPRAAAAITVPANFVVENAVPGASFLAPVTLAFLPDGRWIVGEKRGRLYLVDNGVKLSTPLLEIEREVLDANDRGLLGLAVDPQFATNRYLYLLYTVDPDSNNVESNDDAFARLTRYQVSATHPNQVDLASRTVLIGATWRTGIPSGSSSHTIGTLRFGADGSLLVSCGDGAQFNSTDAGGRDPGLFGDTRTDPYEDIGAFRAQYLGSLAGKILRVNPANGHGYPSNPFWDGNPSSNRSRVWAYGLRNPFRFAVRPGTGSTDPAAGSPGALYVADVGWATWEEHSVADVGGRNFGWPCYEAFANTSYQSATPAHHGCGTIGTGPDNPSPHTRPVITHNHDAPGSSTPPGLFGYCAVGGAWYTGTLYPAAYRQRYFFADYGASWIRAATMSATHQVISIADFATGADAPVCIETEPQTGDLVYIALGTSQVRRIRYTGATGNAAPIAVAGASPEVGVAPLGVQFSSAGSFDPDGDPLATSWSFGDGQGSTAAAPLHTYAAAGAYEAILTVTDGRGGVGRDTVRVIATPAAAFPATAVLDAFDRPDGPIGGSWVGVTSGLRVSGNAITPTSGYVHPVWNGAVFGADQEAHVRLAAIAAQPELDLMLKVQGVNWTDGHLEVRYDAVASRVEIATYTAGTGWQVRGSFPAAFADGDVLGARALANGAVEVFRNGARIGAVSVAGWAHAAAGGRIGLTVSGPSSARLDDFGGGTFAAGGNTPPTATIVTPAHGSFFSTAAPVLLDAAGSDAQDPPEQLAFRWELDLHHNVHVHPISHAFDRDTASYLPENHDDGTGVFYRVRLIVTDRGGLKDTSTVDIFPDTDLEPSAVVTTPASPTDGAPADYQFRLHNRGPMPARISRWMLRAGSTLLAQGDTIVAGRDSVTVTRRLGPVLSPGTHALRVVADTLQVVTETNESNNAVTRALTVVAAPDVTPPPFTSGPTATPGSTSATVAWTAGESSRGAVRYGTTPSLGDSVTTGFGTSHAPVVSGLARGTTYHFRVAITDAAGNTTLSAPSTFATLANRPPAISSVTANPPSGGAPLAVQLAAAASDPDGDPLAYSWAFGDGQSGAGASVSHVYAAGSFTAVVTVSDGAGGIATGSVAISAVPGGFPTTPVLDSFSRPNGPIGGSWISETTNLVISGQQLTQTGSGWRSPVWNGGVYGPDQEAYVRLNAITATSPEHDLMLKIQGTTWSSGHLEIRYDHTVQKIFVGSYASTTGWVTHGTISPVTLAPGDVLGGRATASGTVEVFRNGTRLGTYSVASWPFAANGGRIGLTLASATASLLDDFGGGTVVTNTPPLAAITAPADRSFYAAGEAVSLAGTGSDAQEAAAALSYRWDVELRTGGAVVSSATLAGAGASFVPQTAAGADPHYAIRLIVTDGGGLADTAAIRLDPEIDLEPSPVTVTPDPATDAGPAEFRFAIRNLGRMAAPASRWVLRAGGALLAEGDVAVAGGDSAVVVRSIGPGLAVGSHLVRLTADSLAAVRETQEGNNARTRSLSVADGVPPSFASGPAATPGAGSVTVQWTTSEPSRGALRWGPTPALGESAATALGTSHAASFPTTRGATYSWQVAATDPSGNTRLSAVGTVSVPPNRAPVIASLEASPAAGPAPLAVHFACAVTDPDGDPLAYQWDFGDGQGAAGASPVHAYGVGEHLATLVVSDGFGGSDTATVAISAANLPPQAGILEPRGGAGFVAGLPLALEASATDGQEPAAGLDYRWEIDLHDWTETRPGHLVLQGASASLVPEADAVGYTIRLIVTDSGGLQAGEQVEVHAEVDLAPSVVTVTPAEPTNAAPAEYRFAVHNRGRMPAPPTRWVLAAGATVLAEEVVAVGALDSVEVVRVLPPTLPPGDHLLRVEVDALASVVEIDEENNARIRPLAVADVILPGFAAGPAAAPGFGSTLVQWTTTEPASGVVRYGPSAALGDSAASPPGLAHAVTLPGLAPSTLYHYRVAITDAGGHTALSAPATFTTSASAAQGFPATPVRDDFNRPDGPVGGAWVSQTGNFAVEKQQLAFTTMHARTAIWNGAVFGADQEAYVTLSALASGAALHGVALKVQGTALTAGRITVDFDRRDGRVWVRTHEPGAGWRIRGSVAAALADGDRLGARAYAGGVVEVYRNASRIGVFSTAGWPFNAQGGRLGLTLDRGGASRLDDFGGGGIPAEPVVAGRGGGGGDPTLIPESGRASLPAAVAVSAAFPNPSREAVWLELALPEPAPVAWSVLDLQGRVVASGSDGFPAGRHRLALPGRTPAGALAPGVYLARVRIGGEIFHRRWLRVR